MGKRREILFFGANIKKHLRKRKPWGHLEIICQSFALATVDTVSLEQFQINLHPKFNNETFNNVLILKDNEMIKLHNELIGLPFEIRWPTRRVRLGQAPLAAQAS